LKIVKIECLLNGPREISEALSHDTLVDWLFCHLEKLSKDEISQQLEIKHLEEREVKGEILPPSIVAEGPAFNVIWEKQV